jgi:DNA-directed RNA polymerase subunit RPC12/RpoP
MSEGQQDPAVIHSTEQTRTYPCENCGGQMEFDIASQKLRCPSCGSEREIAGNGETVVVEKDFNAALTELRARAANQAGPQFGAHEIVCQSCGGHTTFDGTLTATRCPYCATPIQRDDVQDAPTRLPVDGILPFSVDEKQARGALEHWVNKRWFAPSEFKKYKRAGSFTSVYGAAFTYDADTTSNYQGRRGDDYTVSVGSGEDQHTETRTDWTHVSGTVSNTFDDVLVFANDGFEAKHVRALEPWPTQGARPFSQEYVAGHLSRTYDRDVEACLPEARGTMDSEIRETVKRDIGGDHQDVNSVDTSFNKLTFKHLLLPIWLLTVIYEGRPFQVVINGVTGEVHGQRPWSLFKIVAASVAAFTLLVVLIIVYAVLKSK